MFCIFLFIFRLPKDIPYRCLEEPLFYLFCKQKKLKRYLLTSVNVWVQKMHINENSNTT